MPPLTCCVLCSSSIWTCDPPWPSYYRGITLFSIKRVQRFCLFSNLLRKWPDLNRRPKVLSIPLLYPTELHFALLLLFEWLVLQWGGCTCIHTTFWVATGPAPPWLSTCYRLLICTSQVLITNHFWNLWLAVRVGATPIGTWTIVLGTL